MKELCAFWPTWNSDEIERRPEFTVLLADDDETEWFAPALTP